MATYPSKAYPQSPRHSKYAEQIEGIAGLFRKERDLGFPHCVRGEGGKDARVTVCVQVENVVKPTQFDKAVGMRKYVTYLPTERDVWDPKVNPRERVTDEDVFRKVSEKVVRMFANCNNGRVHFRAMAVWVEGMEAAPVLFGD